MDSTETPAMRPISKSLQICMGMLKINSELNVRMTKILSKQTSPEDRQELLNDIIQFDISMNMTMDILKDYEKTGSKLDIEEFTKRESQKHLPTSLARSEDNFGTIINVKLVDEDELKQLLREKKKDGQTSHMVHLSDATTRLTRLSTDAVSIDVQSEIFEDPIMHCSPTESDQRRSLSKRKIPHMASMQNGRRRGGRQKQQRRF